MGQKSPLAWAPLHPARALAPCGVSARSGLAPALAVDSLAKETLSEIFMHSL